MDIFFTYSLHRIRNLYKCGKILCLCVKNIVKLSVSDEVLNNNISHALTESISFLEHPMHSSKYELIHSNSSSVISNSLFCFVLF
jgi:hypothetical protein